VLPIGILLLTGVPDGDAVLQRFGAFKVLGIHRFTDQRRLLKKKPPPPSKSTTTTMMRRVSIDIAAL